MTATKAVAGGWGTRMTQRREHGYLEVTATARMRQDRILHHATRFVIAKKAATQRDLFFVAVVDGWVVGTAMGGFDGHRGWLYTVAVHPDWRRRSIGTALVRRVETELVALGCPKLNLQVRASSAAVVAFYERLGFAVEERVSMGKRLGP
jgi:ribosomal protein S18 acetylase RimI-like enzyme